MKFVTIKTKRKMNLLGIIQQAVLRQREASLFKLLSLGSDWNFFLYSWWFSAEKTFHLHRLLSRQMKGKTFYSFPSPFSSN